MFIAILVCAGYYCLPGTFYCIFINQALSANSLRTLSSAVETEAGAVTLAQLTDVYYRNLGSLNVAPSPADLNELTVTALLIGFLWKPVSQTHD